MNKKYLTLILVLSALFSIVLPSHAAELKEIRIGGTLSKTKESTILNIIRIHKGDSIEKEDLPLIRQRLLRSGLFVNETIRVDLELNSEEEASLSLVLADRVSLIPIPFFSAGSGGVGGGLMLMDNNFLGFGNTFFFGAMVSDDSQFSGLGYTDKNIGGSSWDLGGMFNYKAEETSVTTTDGEEISAYDSTTLGAKILGTWNKRPWRVEISGGISGADYDFLGDWIILYSPGLSLEYNSLRHRRFMTEGFRAKAGYDLTLYSDELDPSQIMNLDLQFQKLLGQRIQAELTANAQYYGGEDLLSPVAESDILFDTVKTESFYSAAAGLKFVLADFRWGYLGLPVAYEVGVLDGISADNELYHGPSAGLTLNLKKLAMPAVEFKYGYNVETSEGVVNFSLGFSH